MSTTLTETFGTKRKTSAEKLFKPLQNTYKTKFMILNNERDNQELYELERNFRIRIRASLGGKNDKQGWPTIQGSINNGDTYALSAAQGN